MAKTKPCWAEVAGPLAEYADGFRAELSRLGYTPLTAACQLRLTAHLSRWMTAEGISTQDLDKAGGGTVLRGPPPGGIRQRSFCCSAPPLACRTSCSPLPGRCFKPGTPHRGRLLRHTAFSRCPTPDRCSRLSVFLSLWNHSLRGRVQAITWSACYAIFAIAAAMLALGASKHERPLEAQDTDERPSRTTQAYWIALPACASALLLAITNHLTQNVAPIPFLWVLTLALYLLTFILCFESDRTYQRVVFLPLLAIALAGMSYGLYYQYGNLSIYWALPLYAGGLFVCAMVCHGELSRLRPHPRYLTSFYLMLALGGAIGGLFVAVIAPASFIPTSNSHCR